MHSFLEDFKTAWHKPDNGLSRIIIINIGVFALLKVLWLLGKFGVLSLYDFVERMFTIPPVLNAFIFRPWTLLTYFFTHLDFMHILFNMLTFYWFGSIFQQLLGSRKLTAVYILGGICGGLLYLILHNTVPYLIANPGIGMIGASAGVYAIMVGAATIAPEYKMHLLFFGPIKIKYIAAACIFFSVIGLGTMNVGGNIAHLGGVLVGYGFVKRLGKGDDWSVGVWKILDAVSQMCSPKKHKIKVSYRKTKDKTTSKNPHQTVRGTNQEIIDAILDKISESGYENLSAEEKQILFKASQNRTD